MKPIRWPSDATIKKAAAALAERNQRLNAYPRLVTAVRLLIDDAKDARNHARALLGELGEL